MYRAYMASHESNSLENDAGEKSKKYDRQLRLWGDHGQLALESAKVCLINATATGTEILKNIILPGIGSFTIVDGCKVRGEDVGNNFFLDKESIGKSRAQTATELLLELNEDVNGDFVEESVENLLEHNSLFFNTFDIVITTNLAERTLLRLAKHLWAGDVPLMVCRSYGFLGYLRLVVPEHTVIESHPDNAIDDLRLDRPLPLFTHFCDNLHLESMSKKDHSHTPWLVLIYKFLEIWKKQHDGKMPQNYKEKKIFKTLLESGVLHNEEGVPDDEENFGEAIKHVNTALVPTKIPSQIEDILNDSQCTELTSDSKPFWILARAIREFVHNEGEGALPLRGSIPDMTADSERYIQLQTIYKDAAAQDVSIVSNYVQQLLQTLGRDEPLDTPQPSPGSSPRYPQDNISDADIKIFCKNAYFLRVLKCRSLAQEYDPSSFDAAQLAQNLESEDSELIMYIMMRAADQFYSEMSRYPGSDLHSLEADIPKLKLHVCNLLQEWGISQTVKDDWIHEFCRYGGCELHSVAAYMGGAAAHEVIKTVTGQFVPINNTYIYNAMNQSSTTIQL